MKLIGSNTSPYVRKARLVLLEKKLPHDYVVDPPSDPNSEVYRVNPLGRIPALILDDGECIFDSVVIAEYADTLNDTPILIPRNDALARMRVRRWETLADGIMDSAVVVRNEVLRPQANQLAATITLHNNAITHTLQHIAAQLGARDWCEGDTLSLGDLALVSALAYLDLRQPERDWRGAHPNLAAWFQRMSARPSAKLSLADNK
ncbi:MAG: glutathione S-transferase N-terminal domain-containing protein [Gammaproteobacteria bacterium]|nr:glutathione S-transferase [Sideroxydans sp.]MBU3904137.1 glutathione S-transferase N-terminal domain-containing protein [Gammaproteobacteria bacterium]MBU4045962.1 glutathione S-transferase N-terminal domain-containing protein [Gammaproteobacteria bacterium]MBU4150537.1 glutathione S-transferase N-terminal domain-containing protein [Gammaproteobacteria bacterium]